MQQERKSLVVSLLLLSTALFDFNTASSKVNDIVYTNEDVLNHYADYGVKLNYFQIAKDGIINYPALSDSLEYAQKEKLDPCENFYDYVCRGVKQKVDKAAAKMNKTQRDPDSLVHNQIIVDQLEQFFISHLQSERAEFPKDRTTSDMLMFFDKCVNHAEEADEFKDVLVNQFKLDYLAKNSTPELLSFNTDWIVRTHPFIPFFSFLDRSATKEIDAKTGQPVESHEFRIQFRKFLMDSDTLVEYQQWLEPVGITGRPQGLSAAVNDQIQAKLLEIAGEFTKLAMENDVERDNVKGVNVESTTLAEYQHRFPLLDLVKMVQKLFPDANAVGTDKMIIYYPKAFDKCAVLLQKYANSTSEIDKQAMSEYLLWNLVEAVRIPELDAYSPKLCVQGMMYDYFPHPMSSLLAKKMALGLNQTKGAMEIYKSVQDGLKKMLEESDWMKGPRSTYAADKLDHILTTIGSESEIPENKLKIEKLYQEYNLSDQMNWLEMLVQVKRGMVRNFPKRLFYYSDMSVYYNFWKQISIGNANALLPVYHANFSAAYNFGYFGHLLGHEQAHSLQSQNEEYDVHNAGFGPHFWDKAYADKYQERAKCFDKQYTKEFERLYPNFTKADTLKEDLADEVGTRASYYGWKLYQKEHPEVASSTSSKISGALSNFTPEQVFFTANAFPWCFSDRDDPLRNPPKTGDDVHSSAEMRVNLPLKNFPEFAKAFQCKPGQRMNPGEAERCQFY